MAIFDSNCPPYFLPEERQPFLDWLQTEHALGGRYFVLSVKDKVLACGGYFPRVEQQQTSLSWGMTSKLPPTRIRKHPDRISPTSCCQRIS